MYTYQIHLRIPIGGSGAGLVNLRDRSRIYGGVDTPVDLCARALNPGKLLAELQYTLLVYFQYCDEPDLMHRPVQCSTRWGKSCETPAHTRHISRELYFLDTCPPPGPAPTSRICDRVPRTIVRAVPCASHSSSDLRCDGVVWPF